MNQRRGASRGSGNRAAHNSNTLTGASLRDVGLLDKLSAWRENHRTVARNSVQRLLATPFTSMMTITVLAIAMSLPTGFYIVLENLERLTGSFSGSVQMNLYLDDTYGEAEGRKLASSLRDWPEVAQTSYISRAQALEEFRARSGFQQVLDSLPDNPLPAVIVAELSEHSLTSAQAEQLRDRLAVLPEVQSAQIDLLWLQRVQSIIALVREFALGLGIVLAAGVVLVIGNTTRMAIDNRREEIAVTRLVGATHSFIRRPFLYMGVCYGLAGAVLALFIILMGKLALTNNVSDISNLYTGQFRLSGLSLASSALLLVGGVSTGWLGAWLAASYHLHRSESSSQP